MTFKLEINCDHDAFLPDPRTEVDRILGDVAYRIANGIVASVIVDTNGNTVGQYAFKEKQPK